MNIDMKINIDSIKKNLINRYPSFGSIIDTLDYIETRNCVNTNGLPTVGAGQTTIYYHPDFVNSLSKDEQIFAFAHEVCHIAFDHINRCKDKDKDVWNYATDAVINANLKKDGLKLTEGAIDIPWAIKYDAEEMYEKLMKKKNRQQKKNKQTNDSDSKDMGHDTHSLWNEKSINKNKDDIIKAVQKELAKLGEKEVFKGKNDTKLKEILQKIKNVLENTQEIKESTDEQGKIGLSIDASGTVAGNETPSRKVKFNDIGTACPLINWSLVLKKPIEIVELDWSYQNAYLEDGVVTACLEEISSLPSYETEILLDTSISISDEILRNFLRECKNILTISRMKVGCFDTEFYGFTEIKRMEDIDDFTFVGRGGTDFDVVVNSFSQNANNKIIFTDGYANVPKKEIDAIWVVFGDNKINPKGGKVIYIDKNKLLELDQCHDNKVLTKIKK